MKYSHIGLLENRSLLTINPFNPLKNKILEIIDNEVLNLKKINEENNIEIESLPEKGKHSEYKALLDNIDNINPSISIDELSMLIHSLKKIIFKTLNNKEINKIKINEDISFIFDTKKNEINDFIEEIFNKTNLPFLEEYMEYVLDDNLKALFIKKEALEKIRLFKSNLNQIKLSERYYENANEMKDENLKLNLYYYFKLNFVKAYSSIQYHFNDNVKNNFLCFRKDLLDFYLKEYNPEGTNKKASLKDSFSKKDKQFIMGLLNIETIDKKLDFEYIKHGLSYKWDSLKLKATVQSSVFCNKEHSDSEYLKKINTLFSSAWFFFFMTESTYKDIDSLLSLFKNEINLDDLIFGILEFKSLNYMFNNENYSKNIKLKYYNAEKYILFNKRNDIDYIDLNLKMICSKEYSDISFDSFCSKIIEHINIESQSFEINNTDSFLSINLEAFKTALKTKYKLTNQNNEDLHIDILSILCKIANEISDDKIIKNEYILTKKGYKYYLKTINKNTSEEVNTTSLFDLNISRYLFLYFLSNEVRYHPNLLIEDSPSLKKYEYLKKEAGSILPKQFLYDAVGKILNRPLAIPFSNI